MKLGYGLDEVFKKYNIFLFGTERIYSQSLIERDYDLENTIPYFLIIDNRLRLTFKAWTTTIIEIVTYLQKYYPLPLEELYNFRTKWSKAQIFGPNKFIANCKQIDNNLFVSVNFTALHSLWFIQDILQFYKIDLSTCHLLIHRPPSAEPKEVQNIVSKVVKESFTSYLVDEKNKSADFAKKVVDNFKYFNKVLFQISKSKYDFFLIDSASTLSNYKSRVLIDYKKYTVWSEKQLKIAKECLDYYTDFFTAIKTFLKKYGQTIFSSSLLETK